MNTKYLPSMLSLIFFSGIVFFGNILFPQALFAASKPLPGKSTTVSAKVGSYYLTLSGYIAPYASIVVISNNQALKSAVANAQGYFTISDIIVNQGFSDFCLDAVDVKRLGESYTCLTIPPVNSTSEKDNIFLPPTLGLQRSEITVGNKAVIWGYSMPNARVTVYFSNGETYVTQADRNGFYEIDVKMTQAGEYDLFADASFQNTRSLKPDRTTTLVALSAAQQIVKVTKNLLQQAPGFLFGNPWAILWLIIPLLLLIIFLLRKLRPGTTSFIEDELDRFAQHIPFIPHKLHHWWMQGVGY